MNKLNSRPPRIRLLADTMLGHLATWLRILGYDTAYLFDADDYAIIRLARAEDRLILTRDRDLTRRSGLRTLLIVSDSLEEQLRQVWSNIGPPPDDALGRCPVCNQPLVEAAPEAIAQRVPAYVRATQQRFARCVVCDRIYWRGTHWQQMQSLVRGLRDQASFDTIPDDTVAPE